MKNKGDVKNLRSTHFMLNKNYKNEMLHMRKYVIKYNKKTNYKYFFYFFLRS